MLSQTTLTSFFKPSSSHAPKYTPNSTNLTPASDSNSRKNNLITLPSIAPPPPHQDQHQEQRAPHSLSLQPQPQSLAKYSPSPPPSYTLPPQLSILPLTPPDLAPFRHLTSLLLPIRYPDRFYSEILTDSTISSLSRVAVWRDDIPRSQSQSGSHARADARVSGKRKRKRCIGTTAAIGKGVGKSEEDGEEEEEEGCEDTVENDQRGKVDQATSTSTVPAPATATATDKGREKGTVIGGIRCRLDLSPISLITPCFPSPYPTPPSPSPTLYIQTLTLLSPYRRLGIATALLDAVIAAAIKEHGITAVYAHVWEANEEALGWYVRRGFEVVGAVVTGYYRRLRPDGARVVWRAVSVGEYVRLAGGVSFAAGQGVGLGKGEDGEGLRDEG